MLHKQEAYDLIYTLEAIVLLKRIFVFLFLLLPFLAFAEKREVDSKFPYFAFGEKSESILKLDLPLFDIPYQIDAMNTVGHGFFSSYANPGMSQSLAVTVDIYSGFNFGMKKFYDTSNMNSIFKYIIYYGGSILGQYALSFSPWGGFTWMHEEYHRAVMSLYGVNSFNTSYIFGSRVINITDEDLERFKAESPRDFIRAHAAGLESEHLFIDQLQRNNFFYNQNYFSEILYLISTIDIHTYMINKNSRSEINETRIEERDFTGNDNIAWVYDLFRPNEPYSGRGIHPTGNGISRYRNYDDLTDQEQAYFRKVGYWQFANYVSPMMFGFRSLPWPKSDIRWNFAFRHYLTSFGTDLQFNLLLNIDKYNIAFIYHSNQNYDHYFPVIEIEMIDFPIIIKNFCIYFSPRIASGMQPKDQGFFTSEKEFYGLIGSRFDFQIAKKWLPYFEVIAKTDGWVAGNEFIDKNISFRLGISARF